MNFFFRNLLKNFVIIRVVFSAVANSFKLSSACAVGFGKINFIWAKYFTIVGGNCCKNKYILNLTNLLKNVYVILEKFKIIKFRFECISINSRRYLEAVEYQQFVIFCTIIVDPLSASLIS